MQQSAEASAEQNLPSAGSGMLTFATQCTAADAARASGAEQTCAAAPENQDADLCNTTYATVRDERRTVWASVPEDQDADLATHAMQKSAETSAEQNWHLCRGSGMLTLCNTMHARALSERRTKAWHLC
jgi:hypothetical protein